MILVDTSVWVAHPRAHDAQLAQRLEAGAVCTHPYVIGEIALGQLRQRDIVLNALQALPQATVANAQEVLRMIARHALAGRGIGYVDVCLLAASALTPGGRLWTHDKRLAEAAQDLGLA